MSMSRQLQATCASSCDGLQAGSRGPSCWASSRTAWGGTAPQRSAVQGQHSTTQPTTSAPATPTACSADPHAHSRKAERQPSPRAQCTPARPTACSADPPWPSTGCRSSPRFRGAAGCARPASKDRGGQAAVMSAESNRRTQHCATSSPTNGSVVGRQPNCSPTPPCQSMLFLTFGLMEKSPCPTSCTCLLGKSSGISAARQEEQGRSRMGMGWLNCSTA